MRIHRIISGLLIPPIIFKAKYFGKRWVYSTRSGSADKYQAGWKYNQTERELREARYKACGSGKGASILDK